MKGEKCPLPQDPTLAALAQALNDAGQWAEITDTQWRCQYLTDQASLMYGGPAGLVSYPVGAFTFGPEATSARLGWQGGQFPLEIARRSLAMSGPWLLGEWPHGRAQLRELVDPRLHEVFDSLSPSGRADAITYRFRGVYTGAGTAVEIPVTNLRVREDTGRPLGWVAISKPAVGMAALTRMAAMGDLRHFERMQEVAKAGRRPAAILFADLESSSPLARRLSTASYFTLGRRMTRAADKCVIDAGGLVGRHVGDGVVAFFLAETIGSESAAARSCIEGARNLRRAMSEVATRSELAPGDLVMRLGLHWGATLYVGQIATSGRTEITALGDEVNEGARIEACATGGLLLASKELLERLAPDDAAALSLSPDRVTYTPLAELSTATEKARRDAPAIAVCEV